MAQRTQILFTDDLDGSEAEGTVRFGLDGTGYEIDLNSKHAQELRDVLDTYVTHGRRVTAAPSATRRRRQPAAHASADVAASNGTGSGVPLVNFASATSDTAAARNPGYPMDTKSIREWALKEKIDGVKERGKLTGAVKERYQDAKERELAAAVRRLAALPKVAAG